MSKKPAASPFQALEEEAYHAFREWPIWLVLRERELAAHLDSGKPPVRPPEAESAHQPTSKQHRH